MCWRGARAFAGSRVAAPSLALGHAATAQRERVAAVADGHVAPCWARRSLLSLSRRRERRETDKLTRGDDQPAPFRRHKSAPASLNGRSSRRWAHGGPLSTYGPKVRVKIGARVAESQISAAAKVSGRHFTGRSRRAGRRGGTRRVAEGGGDLGAALDERCGPEGWHTPRMVPRRAPRRRAPDGEDRCATALR